MYKIYLKTHNKTGLKYLGYTAKDNVNDYQGSGIRWKKHISKHGYDVTTEVLSKTKDENELKQLGLYWSKKYNIIENEDFANLKEESGISGKYSKETKEKMSKSAKKRCEKLGAPKAAWTSESASELNKKTWADPKIRKKRIEGISESLKGRKNGPRSEQFKQVMKEKLTGRSYGKGVKHNLKVVVCPHCGKEGKGPNMTRYHFDKCINKGS